MAIKLNLLPPELAVDKNLSQILKVVRSLNVILISTFFVFIVVVSAIFIISYTTLNNLESQVGKAKSQITASETSEQQVVLLKDRLSKIGDIQNIPSGLTNLLAIEPFLTNLSADSSLNELVVDSKKTQMLLTFKTNSDLTTFVESMSKSNSFKSVILSSFSLSPSSGYSVGVDIENK